MIYHLHCFFGAKFFCIFVISYYWTCYFSQLTFNILNAYQCPDSKKKSIGTGVCLSELSHYHISEKRQQQSTHRNNWNRELTRHKKKTRKDQRKASLRARRNYYNKNMRSCVYGKHFGLCAQNQSTITGSINRNQNNYNNNNYHHLCHRSKWASFSTGSGADLSCTTWWKAVVGCATSAAEPTIVAIP